MEPETPRPPQSLQAGRDAIQVGRDYSQTKTVSFNLSLWVSLAALVAVGSYVWLKGGELPWEGQPFPETPGLTLPSRGTP